MRESDRSVRGGESLGERMGAILEEINIWSSRGVEGVTAP